jgi:hypothetical protein
MTARKQERKNLLKRPPSPDNDFRDELNEQCARAMVAWLKTGVNTQRAIRTLSLPEMKGLAEAATSTWICAVSKRIQEEPESPEIKHIAMLLG